MSHKLETRRKLLVSALLYHCFCILLVATTSVDQLRENVDQFVAIATDHDGEENVYNLEEDFADPKDSHLREKAARVCVPIFTLPVKLSDYGNSSYSSNYGFPISAQKSSNTSLSFAINDIDMPVVHSESSLNAAMKLLSSFNSQFEQDSGAQEAASSDNIVKFRENRLRIEGLNLSMLNVHLHTENDSKFGIGIVIRNTTLTGKFAYNGPLLLTDSKLSGYYRMSIDNIYLVATSNLTKQLDSPVASGSSSKVDVSSSSSSSNNNNNKSYILKTNDFRLNITNLGYITIDILDSSDSTKPTSNYLLRMLQRFLQRTVKRTYFTFEDYIRRTLEEESKRAVDCELTRFSPLLDKSSASSHQSDLAKIINAEINRSQLNWVALPGFEYQQNVLGASAIVQFQNGSLGGLDNLKLNGDTRIKLQDDHLYINTSIGWSDLRPYYNWSLHVANTTRPPIAKGFVSFNVRRIDFDAVITKGLVPHTKIVVEQLNIKRLDNPRMDIGGLPGLNRLTRGMVNFFMGRLKQRLASSIQPALQQQLEKSLNRMNLLG